RQRQVEHRLIGRARCEAAVDRYAVVQCYAPFCCCHPRFAGMTTRGTSRFVLLARDPTATSKRDRAALHRLVPQLVAIDVEHELWILRYRKPPAICQLALE